MRSAATLGAGPIENSPDQKVHHVQAGTMGRLLRLCMNIARNHPEWRPVGKVEHVKEPDGKTVFKTRLERP